MTTRILSPAAQQGASIRSKPPVSAVSAEYRELTMQFVNGYGTLSASELTEMHTRIRELWQVLEAQSDIFGK